ncbi:glycosyltransferase 87 family protein [Dactylosporangium sp. NPDC051484]|uniref:glycosyltransferase 87 family protein n=1 Tax=Dactylosporangium sp. NPDC051484 TaxID=3154942 RepID=UPI00344F040A
MADLSVYYGAVQWARAGRPLYDYAADNGDPFTYPPFAAIVMWPLTALPLPSVRVLWLAGTCLAVALIAYAITRRLGRANLYAAAAACVLAVSAPIQSDLRFGQVSVFVVVLALSDALDLLPPRWRGVLIGIAAAIKLTPLLFVVYYLIARRHRDALRSIASFLAAGALAAALLPADSRQFWTHTIAATSRIGDLASLGNQSLHALLARAGVGPEHRLIIWGALVSLICGLALWRARQLADDGRPVHAAVLVGCATVAASPVSWTHHQVWPVLAGMLLVASGTETKRAAGVFLLAVMTLSLANVVGESISNPGLQYLFSNARGIGVIAICCIGFGAVAHGRLRLPAMVRIRRALVTVLAGVAMFALLPLPPSYDPGLRTYSLAEAEREFSMTEISCDGGPCDMSFGGQLVVNYSVGGSEERYVVNGWVADRVAKLAVRTAPGAPIHFIPIMTIDGQRIFCFGGTNLYYGQLLIYDTAGRLIENPPRALWK